MLYADFERAFEVLLQPRADLYVNAVEYHRAVWTDDSVSVALRIGTDRCFGSAA